MKNYDYIIYLFLTFLLLSCNNESFLDIDSQKEKDILNERKIKSLDSNSYCYFNENNSQTYNSENLSIQDKYCVRIYVHVIRRDNGTGGQSVENINESIDILKNDFTNISFIWDGNIDYINNTNYYEYANSNIFTDNSLNNIHTNGVDIYFFDDNELYEIAPGHALRSLTAFRIGGYFKGFPAARTSIISHEMGHIFDLLHTDHGLCAPSNNDCFDSGDKVCDTPYDPGMEFKVDPLTCQWQANIIDFCYEGAPDTRNIMALSNPSCIEYFTPGQDVRMRESIESSIGSSLTNLENAILDCNYCSSHQVYNLTNYLDGREPYINCNEDDCESFYWDFDSQYGDIVEFEFQYEQRNEVNGVVTYNLIYSEVFDNQYVDFIQTGFYTHFIENATIILQGNTGGRWRVRARNGNRVEPCEWSRWKHHN